MNAVQEITVWDSQYQPNHIYLMDGNNAVAYIPVGTTTPFYFKKSIQINTRDRRFVPVIPNPFKAAPNKDIVKVTGSKGEVYFVNKVEKTCTCMGFVYRGQCKHIKDLK